ncbi:periplasmic sensor signal transduction histidine kinase [Glycocaulis alkaliphilus]|uniref:histidine kinase n=1 Tax=Glycocaulis alkaliphilus TaxID=1434191 RepID=A0A3T0E6I9_9PROT|nr:ATP-binding protein [Glycocaulis alkaliphilus]AZU02983.1 periplasmic sensor signal transduction histidine kinase [Glycocaulis alkaliphilus]GGB70082.1 two-component sensor histidine kinase [Glycocaulis alkaliphilus]
MRLAFKRYLPTSLFGRSLLIIVLPVAIMQVAVTWSFFEEHWQTVTARLSESVAGDVALVTALVERSGPESVDPIANLAFETVGLSVDLREGDVLPTSRRTAFFRALDRSLRRALTARLDNEFWFDTTRYPEYVDIRVQVDAGVLRFIASRERAFATTGHIFILWIVGASTLLSAVSIIFIRNQAKPIQRLAAAAEAFGRGQDTAGFRPAGAREVRLAATAFIDMRERLVRYVEQRTALLAGVSHDLRTPLTRLRLQLAMMPAGPDREAAIQDIAEMEMALDEYLAFARGQSGEESAHTDLAELCRSLAAKAGRSGCVISLDVPDVLTREVRPGTLNRAVSNLVNNAAAHGNTVSLSLVDTGGRIEFRVEDDGPGIPPELYEEAFRPFSRLDPARNSNTTGVGLGLAIARDAARAHGGDVFLEHSGLGGLKAVLWIPA